jgi:FAD/FMN-containing dehydrogenase
MTVSQDTLSEFKNAIRDMASYDDPKLLEAKSRDYYWYSPILRKELEGRRGQILVRPETEDDVISVAAACANLRIPLTLRGGGTCNYGQCVPLDGGVIMEMTKLDRVIEITSGRVVCEAGARIERVEQEVAKTGQMLTMFPSTKRIATIGGFLAGGSGGIGSLRHGVLRDDGNVDYVRVVTVEPEPKVVELTGTDIQLVQHAYGTNGIITQMDFKLRPATDWRHMIALFDGYDKALRAALAAHANGVDCYLLSVVERRFSPFYRRLSDFFPKDRDAVFAMVSPDHMEAFRATVAACGGAVALDMSLHEIEAARLPPAWECGWNHTTLQALKAEPKSWTYSQVSYPQPFDPSIATSQKERLGDEVFWHHELAMAGGALQVFAIPLVRWQDEARVRAINLEFEDMDGCTVFDPHVVTIEDGGMKTIGTGLVDFKKCVDPRGLMNPGKTSSWTADMAE